MEKRKSGNHGNDKVYQSKWQKAPCYQCLLEGMFYELNESTMIYSTPVIKTCISHRKNVNLVNGNGNGF